MREVQNRKDSLTEASGSDTHDVVVGGNRSCTRFIKGGAPYFISFSSTLLASDIMVTRTAILTQTEKRVLGYLWDTYLNGELMITPAQVRVNLKLDNSEAARALEALKQRGLVEENKNSWLGLTPMGKSTADIMSDSTL